MTTPLDLEKIEELRGDIVSDADTAGCKVEFVLDDEVIDYHGEDYLPAKFVVKETCYHTEVEVLIKKNYDMVVMRGEDTEEDYSGQILWLMLYFERGNVAWREKDK